MAVLRPSRAVDFAAGQLLIRERGFAIAMPDGQDIGRHPLDLQSRSRIVAARTPELCARLAEALLTP
jgi:fructose-1,6-bisphosphatase/inositol monophosphatase family enzyme